MDPQTAPSYMSITCTRRTLFKPNFMRVPHAQPSLSNIFKWDLNSASRPTRLGQNFQLPPKIKIPNLHIVRYTCQFEQNLSHRQNEHHAHPSWAPTKEPTMSFWRYTPSPKQDRFKTSWKLFVQTISTQLIQNKITNIVIPTYLNC